MKVFLKKTVPRLGKAGEEVLVKNGYARNFLIPQEIAVAVKNSNIKILERQKTVILKQKRLELEKATDIAEKLKGVLLEFSLKSNQSGKLFGAVTAKHIVDKLVEKDIHLNKKCLDLPVPLKEVGQYSVNVKLADELVEKIRVVLTIEKEEFKEEKIASTKKISKTAEKETKSAKEKTKSVKKTTKSIGTRNNYKSSSQSKSKKTSLQIMARFRRTRRKNLFRTIHKTLSTSRYGGQTGSLCGEFCTNEHSGFYFRGFSDRLFE